MHGLMDLLARSLGQLTPSAKASDFERIAILLHDVMSARWRGYHTSNHLFDVCSRLKEPMEILAALGHDLVYLQVDRRIHPQLEPVLKDFKLDDKFRALPVAGTQDELLPLFFAIFGLEPKAEVDYQKAGNEFLSAVAWARLLKSWLTPAQALELAILIEGTIPFRAVTSQSDTPHLRLLARLEKLAALPSGTHLKTVDLSAAIARSVRLANSDMHGFGFEPLANFLDNTWLLILEGNPIFKNPVYSARQYREALGRIDAFFRGLKPESLFAHDGNVQRLNIYKKSVKGAQRNLSLGAEYVETKMLALSLFEAMGQATGGEAPLILFFGNPVTKAKKTYFPLENAIRWKCTRKAKTRDPILNLLTQGRRSEGAGFDISRSPVAAEIRARLSAEELASLGMQRARFEKGELASVEYLALFPKTIIQPVLAAAAAIAQSRTAEIAALAKEIRARARS